MGYNNGRISVTSMSDTDTTEESQQAAPEHDSDAASELSVPVYHGEYIAQDGTSDKSEAPGHDATDHVRPDAEHAKIDAADIPVPSPEHRRRFGLRLRIPHIAIVPTVLVIVGLLNVIAAGANVYVRARQPAAVVPKSTATTLIVPKATKPVTAPSVPAASTSTLHYVSKPLNLEFDYPVDWRIEGSADDKSLSLSSAPFSINADGKSWQGVIELSIEDPKAYGDFSFFSDTDVITADSEVLTYTSPTSFQRKTSHVSFEGSAPTPDFPAETGFIFITGNLSYKQGQLLSSQNYKSIDPHIYAYFNPCHFQVGCQAFTNVAITSDEWHTNPEFVKLRTLLASLRFTQ